MRCTTPFANTAAGSWIECWRLTRAIPQDLTAVWIAGGEERTLIQVNQSPGGGERAKLPLGACSIQLARGMMASMVEPVLVIDVLTPLGFRVVCTEEQWERIATIKHPPMRGRMTDVIATLAEPDVVRRSVRDANVVLFHRQVPPRWVCAVARRADGIGYLITAYPADKVKSGELLWTK